MVGLCEAELDGEGGLSGSARVFFLSQYLWPRGMLRAATALLPLAPESR